MSRTDIIIVDRMRQLTHAAKLQMVFDMMAEMHAMQVEETRRRMPAASEQEINDRVAARWLGKELFERVRIARDLR